MDRKEIEQAFLKLHAYLLKNGYRGYEFDDLLASPVVRFFTFNCLLLMRIAIQLGEKFPLNIRPLLGVKKLESTKARGFFARGYFHFYLYTGERKWKACGEEHLEWLLRNCSQGFEGISWGNAFDFASRGGVFKKGLPTVVWTAHIAEAFRLGFSITGKEKYLEVLRQAAGFVSCSLERHEDEKGICFAYAPGRLEIVHNSNLLGAAILLSCWKYFRDEEFFELARKAYRWSLSYMNPDGSWHYGVGDKYHWIDNFHTAYVIDTLLTGHEVGGEEVVEFQALERSYRYWIEHFFEENGAPRYYAHRLYPLDIQSAAQAVETLSKMSLYFGDALPLAEKVLAWTLTRMQKANGSFCYQIRRCWKSNLESIHWGQSTMLSALGAYLYCSVSKNKKLEKNVTQSLPA